MNFESIDPRLFFSRQDATDPRLGDLASDHSLAANPSDLAKKLQQISASERASERTVVFAGYPDDEGIKINGGRLGAALGPDAVRKPLYKMTPSLFSTKTPVRIFDLGNLKTTGLSLEDRHTAVSEIGLAALTNNAAWISVGGGHDYGFPDAKAYIEWAQARGERPLILNFDAHLDVRPVAKGISSGTPFFRMLEAFPNVDFAEIGIQSHCNSRAHYDWALARGARILSQEEVLASGESFSTQVMKLLDDWILKPRSAFLSIDIDGFSSAVAPGCSQSWATGFGADEFFAILEILRGRLDIRALGIYEVSPPLDSDDRTAKLAAQIIHRVIS
jgi:formiminoglutamase